MTAASTALSPNQATSSGRVAVRQTIMATCRFGMANVAALALVLWLPMALMSVSLFLTFKLYFSLLSAYLAAPSAGLASIAISATIAGFVVCVLIAAIESAHVMRLMKDGRTAAAIKLKGLEARMFAAALRFLFIVFMGVAIMVAAFLFASQLLSPRLTVYAGWAAWIAAIAFAATCCVRLGLLIPALAAYERRSILRRGWTLSRGRPWRLMLIWLMAGVLPWITLQILGELAISWSSAPILTTLGQTTERLAGNDVAVALISATLTLSTTLAVTLTTAASYLIYQQLNELP